MALRLLQTCPVSWRLAGWLMLRNLLILNNFLMIPDPLGHPILTLGSQLFLFRRSGSNEFVLFKTTRSEGSQILGGSLVGLLRVWDG